MIYSSVSERKVTAILLLYSYIIVVPEIYCFDKSKNCSYCFANNVYLNCAARHTPLNRCTNINNNNNHFYYAFRCFNLMTDWLSVATMSTFNHSAYWILSWKRGSVHTGKSKSNQSTSSDPLLLNIFFELAIKIKCLFPAKLRKWSCRYTQICWFEWSHKNEAIKINRFGVAICIVTIVSLSSALLLTDCHLEEQLMIIEIEANSVNNCTFLLFHK